MVKLEQQVHKESKVYLEPQEQQVPAGINVPNGTNVYAVFGDTAVVNNTGEGAVNTAICDDGDTAITGAFSVSTPVLSSIGTYDLRFSGHCRIHPWGKMGIFYNWRSGYKCKYYSAVL